MTRRGPDISDAEWQAVHHLPGRWTSIGDYLCRVRYSQRSRGWIASVYWRHDVSVLWRDTLTLRQFDMVNGDSVLGVYATPELAEQAAASFLQLRANPERLCGIGDLEEVRKQVEQR